MSDTKLGFEIPVVYFCIDCLPDVLDGTDPLTADDARIGFYCERCGAALHGRDPK